MIGAVQRFGLKCASWDWVAARREGRTAGVVVDDRRRERLTLSSVVRPCTDGRLDQPTLSHESLESHGVVSDRTSLAVLARALGEGEED